MKPSAFDYRAPSSIEDAIRLLAASDGNAKILAGGQSLMPMLAFRLAAPGLLVDLKNCQGLDHIAIGDDGVRLGARVRWCDIEMHKSLAAAHPLLAASIEHVAHYQVRHRGTVGGSLAHADPASELPGVAIACEAEITIVGSAGSRKVAARDFFTGVLETCLEADEIVTELRLPAWPAGRRWSFQEFSRRKGDFAMAGVALFYDLDGQRRVENAHVGAIGMSDRPIRLFPVENHLNGWILDDAAIEAAVEVARTSVEPLPDLHAPAAYRASLFATLLGRALKQSLVRSL